MRWKGWFDFTRHHFLLPSHNCSSNFEFDTLRHAYEMNHFITIFPVNMLMSISWKIYVFSIMHLSKVFLPLLLLFFEHNTWALRIGSSIYRSSSTYGKRMKFVPLLLAYINERNLNFMQVSTFKELYLVMEEDSTNQLFT